MVQVAKNDKVTKKVIKKGQITEFDNYLFHEGKNYNSYRFMGAHSVIEKRKRGIRFTVWAAKASMVYIVGDFSEFKPLEKYKMEKIEFGVIDNEDEDTWCSISPAANDSDEDDDNIVETVCVVKSEFESMEKNDDSDK